jgi:hypothetical protein
MAKEDFCFTYYDGDATRDMQHMDRLCRGAYTDLIIMQRKIQNGRLSMGHIKAVLGVDFEKCWYSLEIVLKKDGEFFFIEWVENSVVKMRKSCSKQKQKADKRWGQENAAASKNNAAASKNDSTGVPLEDGNESEDGNEIKKRNEPVEMPMGFLMDRKFREINPKYPQRPSKDMPAIIEWANFINSQSGSDNTISFFTAIERTTVMDFWEKFAEWYRDTGETNDLDYLQKYKLQKIYTELKHGTAKKPFNSSYSNGGNNPAAVVIRPDKAFNTAL